jgi:hypothetical protein
VLAAILPQHFNNSAHKNKNAEHTVGSSFGSSAIFLKTRRFPPPSHGGFGFIGIFTQLFFFITSIFNTETLPFNKISQMFNPFNLL